MTAVRLDWYRSLFEESLLPSWLCDAATLEILEVNRTAREQYGYSREEFLTKRLTDLLRPEEISAARELVDRGDAHFDRGVWEHRKASGEWITVDVCAHRIAEPGRPLLHMIMHRTPAESYQTVPHPGAMREVEERFRVLAENLDTVVWISKPGQEEVIYLSPAFERVWGISRAQVYAAPGLWIESIHPDDRERVLREAAERRRTRPRRPPEQIYRIVRPDAQIRWIRARILPVFSSDGSVDRVVGLADDITLQRLAEDSALHSGLELQESREQLRLQELRVKISADLHDDIGSTLSSTSIFSAMLRQVISPGDARATELLDRIDRNLRETQEALHDIVWSIDPDNDLLGSVVLRMREFAAETIEGQGIGLDIDTGGMPDATRIPMAVRRDIYFLFKEAIANLVIHSACTQASVRIIGADGSLHVEVSDNGRGFDPSAEYPGSGLTNMALRARVMGARLVIDSQPGRGTSVILRVPIA